MIINSKDDRKTLIKSSILVDPNSSDGFGGIGPDVIILNPFTYVGFINKLLLPSNSILPDRKVERPIELFIFK